MIPMSLREIADVVGGQLLNSLGDEMVTTQAFLDTRLMVPGGLFVAFVGESLDGHDFAEEAIKGGAVAAMVTRDVGVPSVQVVDPEASLQQLAAHLRSLLPELTVVGITGSQGKTTTKDLLAAILSAQAPTIAPPGSLNNELGVPLTLLRCSESTRYCILEMGARHEGDIEKLAKIAKLDVGAVLNIGSAHIGAFGSSEALANAKGEMVAALTPDAIAVLGTYDAATKRLVEQAPCRVITFGESPEAMVKGEEISLTQGKATFKLTNQNRSVPVTLEYFGRHQVANAVAAAAIAVALGIELPTIGDALSAATPKSRWRMEVRQRHEDGVTVINDAYNANPQSMAAAIELLAEWANAEGRPSWAVLGQMHELGASSDEEHRLIGRLVAERGITHLLVVGSGAGEILNGAREMAMADARIVADSESAHRYLHDRLEPDAVVLVKASRAEGLEKLAETISGEQA